MKFIDEKVKLGKNVKIYDNVYIFGESEIGDDVVIYPNSEINNSKIGEKTEIKSSVINNSIIGKNNHIGPFANIRDNTLTRGNVKIGAFVETKNCVIGENTKASHLAYVGDVEIGENVNIGCGVIFVNYNGKIKQKSFVGDNSFIGSNSNIIAPVKIGNNAYICAGSNVTNNVEDGDFVIGRVRQENKKNRAKKYLKNN